MITTDLPSRIFYWENNISDDEHSDFDDQQEDDHSPTSFKPVKEGGLDDDEINEELDDADDFTPMMTILKPKAIPSTTQMTMIGLSEVQKQKVPEAHYPL